MIKKSFNTDIYKTKSLHSHKKLKAMKKLMNHLFRLETRKSLRFMSLDKLLLLGSYQKGFLPKILRIKVFSINRRHTIISRIKKDFIIPSNNSISNHKILCHQTCNSFIIMKESPSTMKDQSIIPDILLTMVKVPLMLVKVPFQVMDKIDLLNRICVLH